MTESSKQRPPREFWVFDDGAPEFDRRVLDRPISANDVHVIEASFAKELEAKLAVAVKALEFYSSYEPWNNYGTKALEDSGEVATSALEQIKQMKAGLG